MRRPSNEALTKISLLLVLLLTALTFLAQAGVIGPRRALRVPEESAPFELPDEPTPERQQVT